MTSFAASRHGLTLIVRVAALERAARARRTLMGRYWSVLLPLLEAGVFTLVFGALLGVRGTSAAYLPFAYVGLYAWRVFARGLNVATGALDRWAPALQTFRTAASLVIVGAVAGAWVEGLLGFPLLLAVVFAVEGLPDPGALVAWLPVALLLHMSVTLGLGLLLAALNAFYRDVSIVLGPALVILMFGAPVVYPVTLVPEPYRFAFLANPIAASIECFRAAFLASPAPPAAPLAAATLLALLALVAGLAVMQRHDSRIRELI